MFDERKESTGIGQLVQGLNDVLDEALKQNFLITHYKIKELVNPHEYLGKRYSNREKVSSFNEKFVYIQEGQVFLAQEVLVGMMGSQCTWISEELESLAGFFKPFFGEIYKGWDNKKLLEETKLSRSERKEVQYYKVLEQESKSLLLNEIDIFLVQYSDLYDFYHAIQSADLSRLEAGGLSEIVKQFDLVAFKAFIDFKSAVQKGDKEVISSKKPFLIFKILYEATLNRHFPATGNPRWESDQYIQVSKAISQQQIAQLSVINQLAVQRYSDEFLKKFCLSKKILKLNKQLFPNHDERKYIADCEALVFNPPIPELLNQGPF